MYDAPFPPETVLTKCIVALTQCRKKEMKSEALKHYQIRPTTRAILKPKENNEIVCGFFRKRDCMALFY